MRRRKDKHDCRGAPEFKALTASCQNTCQGYSANWVGAGCDPNSTRRRRVTDGATIRRRDKGSCRCPSGKALQAAKDGGGACQQAPEYKALSNSCKAKCMTTTAWVDLDCEQATVQKSSRCRCPGEKGYLKFKNGGNSGNACKDPPCSGTRCQDLPYFKALTRDCQLNCEAGKAWKMAKCEALKIPKTIPKKNSLGPLKKKVPPPPPQLPAKLKGVTFSVTESCKPAGEALRGCPVDEEAWGLWSQVLSRAPDMNGKTHDFKNGKLSPGVPRGGVCRLSIKNVAEEPDHAACKEWAAEHNYCGDFSAGGTVDVIKATSCGNAKVQLKTKTCTCTTAPKPGAPPISGPNQDCIDSEGAALPYFKIQIPERTDGGEIPSGDTDTYSNEDQEIGCVLAKMNALQDEAEMLNAGKNVQMMANAVTCSPLQGGSARAGNAEDDEQEFKRLNRRLLAQIGSGGRRGAAVGGAASESQVAFKAGKGRGNRAGNDEAYLGESLRGGRRGASLFGQQSFVLSAGGQGNRAGNDEM